MYKSGIYVGEFVDSHLHLLGDCHMQFLTASVFFQNFRIDRQENGMFRVELELVQKPRNDLYGILLGDLRERFEQILQKCERV